MLNSCVSGAEPVGAQALACAPRLSLAEVTVYVPPDKKTTAATQQTSAATMSELG